MKHLNFDIDIIYGFIVSPEMIMVAPVYGVASI